MTETVKDNIPAPVVCCNDCILKLSDFKELHQSVDMQFYCYRLRTQDLVASAVAQPVNGVDVVSAFEQRWKDLAIRRNTGDKRGDLHFSTNSSS